MKRWRLSLVHIAFGVCRELDPLAQSCQCSSCKFLKRIGFVTADSPGKIAKRFDFAVLEPIKVKGLGEVARFESREIEDPAIEIRAVPVEKAPNRRYKRVTSARILAGAKILSRAAGKQLERIQSEMPGTTG